MPHCPLDGGYYSGINTQRNYDDYNKVLPYPSNCTTKWENASLTSTALQPALSSNEDRYIQQDRKPDRYHRASKRNGGGYGNSYAQTAGQNMYDQYLMALNDQIPALRERAFEWLAEGDQLQRQFENGGLKNDYSGIGIWWAAGAQRGISFHCRSAGSDYYKYLNAQQFDQRGRDSFGSRGTKTTT